MRATPGTTATRGVSRSTSRSIVATGDEVQVEVELDVEPRVVVEPTDFAHALDADPAARRLWPTVLQPQAGTCGCHRESQEARDTVTTDRGSSGEPAKSRVKEGLSASLRDKSDEAISRLTQISFSETRHCPRSPGR